jgi:DNA processing protein
MDNDALFKIAIKKIPKVGAVIAKNLISYCGGVENVFKEKKSSLLKIPGVGEKLVGNIQNKKILMEAEIELEKVLKWNIKLLFYFDKHYPERLKPFPSSPILLYKKGTGSLNASKIVAIVGTRKPTEYGKVQCMRMIESLSEYQVTIISGLAYGIDIIAHRASLANNMSTFAVMGSGMGTIYPRQHKKTMLSMLETGGVVTEFDYDTGPDKENFPARNRIIAGMADAILVVESAASGGSMITAEFANYYHKDVFALPGRIGDEKSKGCNALIKDHKAHLVESGEDIAALLRWEAREKKKDVQRKFFTELSEKERFIVELLGKEKAVEIDLLSYHSKMQISELATVLLSLEFKGLVRAMPGKRYVVI